MAIHPSMVLFGDSRITPCFFFPHVSSWCLDMSLEPRTHLQHEITYLLVNVYISMENHHAYDGKTHYFILFPWPFSMGNYFDITRGYIPWLSHFHPTMNHYEPLQGGAPPVISWFIIPTNYRYNLLINPRLIGFICTNWTLTNWGTTLV